MKKLTNFVVLACASALIMISCGKDPVQIIDTGVSRPGPEIQSVSITGPNAELILNAYSGLPVTTRFLLSIDGQPREEFLIQTTAKKQWALANLKTGLYRVRIYCAYPGEEFASAFCSFHFNINDGKATRDLTAQKLDARNYGFDIHVVN
jgi:hypothetical protein